MRFLHIHVVLLAGLVLVSLFSSACGGLDPSGAEQEAGSVFTESQRNPVGRETTVGAGESTSGKADNLGRDGASADAGYAGDVGGQGEVGEIDEIEGDDVIDAGEEEVEEQAEGCEAMCVALEQCHGLPDGVATLEDCRMGCEQSLEEGVLMERDVRCVEEADSCRALGSCMENFWACDEPCDSFMICELQDEPDDCRVWCGVGIGSGAVVAEQFYCLERLGRTEVCDEIAETCGLDWML